MANLAPESATSQVRRLSAHISNPTPLQQSVIDRAFSIACDIDRKTRAAVIHEMTPVEADRHQERQASLVRALAILGHTGKEITE